MVINYRNSEWNQKEVILGETDLDISQPVKLAIGFHGAESTPENMLVKGNFMNLKNGIFVYPQGPIDAGNGLWSWWKDGPGQIDTVNSFLKHTHDILEMAYRCYIEKYPAIQLKTCLWGFSQGGAAALVYTMFGTTPIHKTASVCGFLPEVPDLPSPEKKADVLGIFGADDDVVPAFLAEHALDEIKNRDFNVLSKELAQGHEINMDNLAEVSEFLNS